MSQLSSLLAKRADIANTLEQASKRLASHSNRVKLFGDVEADAEWPADWPVPPHFEMALDELLRAVHDMDVAITEVQQDYRRTVLRWLLAEAEAPR